MKIQTSKNAALLTKLVIVIDKFSKSTKIVSVHEFGYTSFDKVETSFDIYLN